MKVREQVIGEKVGQTSRRQSRSGAQLILDIPIEIRPDIGTDLAANLAGETRLKVGQANLIRPAVLFLPR